jgi:putative ABC transport system permease protein
VTAVLAVPPDEKSRVLLMGRFTAPDETAQIAVPAAVMQELLGTIFTVQSYVVAAIATVALATLITTTLVFLLSLRLRRRERETLVKIGGARGSVAVVLASEVIFVLGISIAIASGLTAATSSLGAAAIRAFLLS